MSNLSRLFNQFKSDFPEQYKSKVDEIEKFIVRYITKNELSVKFLNSCSTGFAGVRTRDQIIICSPNKMSTIGDFLYTIFHEIRHEQQVRDIKMLNPLQDYDLEDFENLYEQYWEMELDSDQFAKNMVATLIMKLKSTLTSNLLRNADYSQQLPRLYQLLHYGLIISSLIPMNAADLLSYLMNI